ncbi:glycosyltransferase family 2 protein [Methylobacterium sp. Leaf91]|uniref:glycosyltransferase family 2 protein n=1 Tax=Methylobacterium sp. Leaf91 TaxID=1736247 RepID=UPI0006FCD4E6|nr:glycosyltransferase family 2 protein [Methylobacterium sp. Leaf91]KQO91548.1 glycosyl transferase [Methylobacterium sp. Leaf91]
MSIVGFRNLRGKTVALPPEIAFLLSHAASPLMLAKAAALARASGTDAATTLIQAGLMEEERFYRALALTLGARFLGGTLPLGAGARFPDSLIAGVAPLALGMGAAFVYAPRGRAIAELLQGRSPTGLMPAITTPTALRHAIFAQRAAGIAAHASDDLLRRRPDWAYNAAPVAPLLALAGLIFGALVLAMASLPALLVTAAWVLVQVGFLALLTFRVAAIGPTGEVAPEDLPGPGLPDGDLPVYTVFVALYREAAVVPRLLEALTRFDYPVAKLDIKLLTEADDAATAGALACLALPAHVEVVVVPPGLPKTKPRALNAALPLARGSCLVVYDAEDVPDPGQLRAAAEAFARASPRTACLQGRLVIDNARDSWLTRCFALEYTALFDVLGPALAAWRLPTPLGGTSTHFRTHILRAVHGWDAWNVTEDADLGLRLARAGYDVGDLPSSTIEEAPARYKAWLNQRTRWMKGFLQTSLTHGRTPMATFRELGPLASLCALALIPGTVVSALSYPFLMLPAVVSLWPGRIEAGSDFWANLPTGTAITVLVSGFVAMLLPAYIGCRRRGWHDLVPFVPLLPAYFLLVSLAAWRGVIELILAPDRWNKTEHGLSRTSRSGALTPHPPR